MIQTMQLGPLPLVGRAAELAELHAAMEGVARGDGSTWLVTGGAGVGKSRLALAVCEEAERRGWTVARGRAFPVESGVPYALFADALPPVVRRLDDGALAVLTRGAAELACVFPWLGAQPAVPVDALTPDFRSRLHWHFTQFLRRLAANQPLLLVLEDLQLADASSLELLHFVARHAADTRLLLLCTLNPDQRAPTAALRAFQSAARALETAHERQLEPLAPAAVEELVRRAFNADGSVTRAFAERLFAWTLGNPFFIEETLKLLVSSGDLRRDGLRWTGWQVDALRLPASVRDVIGARLDGLGRTARECAEIAAVIGTRFPFDTLLAAVRGAADTVLTALDELCREGILVELDDGDDVVYDFAHPLLRETLYAGLTRARSRMLHSRIADALEQRHGDRALEYADELAYHFARAVSDTARDKTVRYLAEAGRRALAKYANREAADYLAAALERSADSDATFLDLVESLARARQRLGEYTDALALWEQVRNTALRQHDRARAAAASRHMGLVCYWSGDLATALRHFDDGLDYAADGGAALAVRLYTAQADCLQELGRPVDALTAAQHALAASAATSEPAILARVHRTLLQLHLWTGDAALARHHGVRALQLAEQSDDRPLAFFAHWAMACLHAFGGDAAGFEHDLAACRRLADELRSPVLQVWAAELALEFASARGEWDAALQIGEEAIRTARALHQIALLPRLLVWTALIYINRGDHARAAAYVDEAWSLSGGALAARSGTNIHAVLAAYIGRTALCLGRGDYAEAVRIGEEGVAHADRAGYVLWVVHRLLPMIAESHLWMRDLDGARRTGERLRADATRLGHRLGIGWADACDACVVWLGGDSEQGAVLLRSAAEHLEALPFVLDATRLRRQLAGRLAEIGERDAALAELRIVHERLLHLGAEDELRKARQQFREIGARPPARGGTGGTQHGSVTERELAVAGLVARHQSSKAIARELDISVRTVDAHLTNIYRKLGINSRAELSDLVRSGLLVSADGVHAPD